MQVGQRLRGSAGAVAAVVGLLFGPLFIVVGLALAYTRIGWSSAIHGALDGIAAAAFGLTFATGLKLLPSGSASRLRKKSVLGSDLSDHDAGLSL